MDLVLVGHVHNYERTCAVFANKCKALPTKDANGTDIYNNAIYSAPVHVVIGMAGFKLDEFPPTVRTHLFHFISPYFNLRVQFLF